MRKESQPVKGHGHGETASSETCDGDTVIGSPKASLNEVGSCITFEILDDAEMIDPDGQDSGSQGSEQGCYGIYGMGVCAFLSDLDCAIHGQDHSRTRVRIQSQSL